MVDGPIIDPFAERVGIEDTPKQDDGGLGRVPILDRVTGGDAHACSVSLGGLDRRSYVGALA